jgi:hypothetical protein
MISNLRLILLHLFFISVWDLLFATAQQTSLIKSHLSLFIYSNSRVTICCIPMSKYIVILVSSICDQPWWQLSIFDEHRSRACVALRICYY